MTISIVVEDGTGSNAAANSYASLSDLRMYAASRGVTVPIVDDDCAILLIRAMDYLEQQRDRYKGVKTSQLQNNNWYGFGYPYYNPNPVSTVPAEGITDQPLQWPRAGVDIDNAYLPSNVIPRELVYGQLAKALLVYDQQVNPGVYERKGAVIENTVAGAVTQKFAVPSTNYGAVLPVSAFADPDTLLRVLYKNGGLSIAVSR